MPRLSSDDTMRLTFWSAHNLDPSSTTMLARTLMAHTGPCATWRGSAFPIVVRSVLTMAASVAFEGDFALGEGEIVVR